MDRDDPQTTSAARMQRDAHMTLLLAQLMDLIQRLALLTGSERVAVARMVAISQAMAYYTRCAGADPQVMASFDHLMSTFSPLLDRRADMTTARADYLVRVHAGMDTQTAGQLEVPGPDEHKAADNTAFKDDCLSQYLKTLLAAVVPPPVTEAWSLGGSRPQPTPRRCRDLRKPRIRD